ncbi:hypothetical protein CKO28_05080 [Rhodovibrio sodomensis]|uniref:N-acetyltransferase domain-containing protein n=1 Tax=Rhodovibrio sodomensis TaxID=1088 RepID=A0ABS1DBU6_9PROT|nr:GNAT family N-acetyltransferase [Rhodovibrio sodomensis]MBK1667402.1 hypothetical protein [Rhodovibrio sodomensis]
MSFRVRAATLSDLPGVLAICRGHPRRTAQIDIAPQQFAAAVDDAAFAGGDSEHQLLVAVQDTAPDRVLAFLLLRHLPDRLTLLQGLGVDPTETGRGIGGRLLHRALGEACLREAAQIQTRRGPGDAYLARFGFRPGLKGQLARDLRRAPPAVAA